MKRSLWILGLGCLLLLPVSLPAQNHGEVGIFGEYLRYPPYNSTTNYVGLGARLGLNGSRGLGIEGELSYDFARNHTNFFNNGASTNFTRTKVRPLTGLFGPKLQMGGHAWHAFVTGKVGFMDFSTSNTTVASPGTFTGAVNTVGDSGTYFAVYPGGGFEVFGGPIGLRAELGDAIYLNNGVHNNMRATFGPSIRF